MTTSQQWYEAAVVLREQAIKFEELAKQAAHSEHTICGVVSQSGPHLEPLACGFGIGHKGRHAWADLPTFTVEEAHNDGEEVTE